MSGHIKSFVSFLFVTLFLIPSASFALGSQTCPIITKDLSYSATAPDTDLNSNGEVTKLQNFLLDYKFLDSTSISDRGSSSSDKKGTFGTFTRDALTYFQQSMIPTITASNLRSINSKYFTEAIITFTLKAHFFLSPYDGIAEGETDTATKVKIEYYCRFTPKPTVNFMLDGMVKYFKAVADSPSNEHLKTELKYGGLNGYVLYWVYPADKARFPIKGVAFNESNNGIISTDIDLSTIPLSPNKNATLKIVAQVYSSDPGYFKPGSTSDLNPNWNSIYKDAVSDGATGDFRVRNPTYEYSNNDNNLEANLPNVNVRYEEYVSFSIGSEVKLTTFNFITPEQKEFYLFSPSKGIDQKLEVKYRDSSPFVTIPNVPTSSDYTFYSCIKRVSVTNPIGKKLCGVKNPYPTFDGALKPFTIKPPDATPIVEIIGRPTVQIIKNSTGKDESILSKVLIKITTKAQSIVAERSDFASMFGLAQYGAIGHYPTISTAENNLGIDRIIPANTSVIYTLSNTTEIKDLESGSYGVRFGNFVYRTESNEGKVVELGSFIGDAVDPFIGDAGNPRVTVVAIPKSTGTFVSYINQSTSPWLTTPNLTQAQALNTCNGLSDVSESRRCTWNGVEIYNSSTQASSQATSPIGTFVSYTNINQRDSPSMTTPNLTQAQALNTCNGLSTASESRRCTWNGTEIFNSFPSQSSAVVTSPIVTSQASSQATSPLGTFVSYLNQSTSPYITTPNLTQAQALGTCNGLSTVSESRRCTWNGNEIYKSSDKTIPAINRLGTSPLTLAYGSSYTDAGATASDNVDGNITSKIVTTGTVNTSLAGTYTIRYNVSDTAGNKATEVTRTVTVSPPVASIPAPTPPPALKVPATIVPVVTPPVTTITPQAVSAPVETLPTGTYTAYFNQSLVPFNTTQGITKDLALTRCMTSHNAIPTVGIRCMWNGNEIYNFLPTTSASFGRVAPTPVVTPQTVPTPVVTPPSEPTPTPVAQPVSVPQVTSPTATMPTGTYTAYFNKSSAPFSTIPGITQEAALAKCMVSHKAVPFFTIGCMWNGIQIYNSSPSPSSTPAPVPTPVAQPASIPQVTVPAAAPLATPVAVVPTGTYTAYFSQSLVPFTTTPGITQDVALARCVASHNTLPAATLRCMWNGTQIYTFSPTTSSVSPAALPVWSDIPAISIPGVTTNTTTVTPPATAPAAVAPSVAVPTPTPSTVGPTGYTFCVVEGGTCSFSGTRNVAYGANGNFYYKQITGATSCVNEVFGDPIVGVVKSCYYGDIINPRVKTNYKRFYEVEAMLIKKNSPAVLGDSTMCLDLQGNLYRGMEKEEITALQTFLMKKKFLDEVTGFYGDKTVQAVKDYQVSRGIKETGMVFQQTRKVINVETCQ